MEEVGNKVKKNNKTFKMCAHKYYIYLQEKSLQIMRILSQLGVLGQVVLDGFNILD